MHYVYVLINESGGKYVGYTSDLRRRFKEHREGKSRYTKGHTNWKLCYYEAFADKGDAIKRERALKQSSQSRRWLYERISKSIELCRKS